MEDPLECPDLKIKKILDRAHIKALEQVRQSRMELEDGQPYQST
jgi:hypothetical protein